MYPEVGPTEQIGAQFIDFTEYGRGRSIRYNDYPATVGMNLVTISRTRPLLRDRRQDANLLYRSTVFAGWLSDQPTNFFQNEVIHEGLHHGELPRIPRDSVVEGPAIGYSGELNFIPYSLSGRDGRTLFCRSPLFLGVGAQLSTINQDFFAQMGAVNMEPLGSDFWIWPRKFAVYPALSGMARVGSALDGFTFTRLSDRYLSMQGSVRLTLLFGSFPVVLEYGLTSTTGLFTDTSSYATGSETRRTKLAKEGLYSTLMLRLGSFSFETFNDTPGGRDEGPSYGVRIYYNTLPGNWLFNSRLFRWL